MGIRLCSQLQQAMPGASCMCMPARTHTWLVRCREAHLPSAKGMSPPTMESQRQKVLTPVSAGVASR